jgi:hypothetical protein
VNADVYAVAALNEKKICVCKPFHFCCRKHEEESPLVGGDGFTVLLDVVANFFHDLLIFGIVAQVVVVFVPLEPGPGSGGVNGGRRFALRPLRIPSDLCDQKLLTAKMEKVRKGR